MNKKRKYDTYHSHAEEVLLRKVSLFVKLLHLFQRYDQTFVAKKKDARFIKLYEQGEV